MDAYWRLGQNLGLLGHPLILFKLVSGDPDVSIPSLFSMMILCTSLCNAGVVPLPPPWPGPRQWLSIPTTPTWLASARSLAEKRRSRGSSTCHPFHRGSMSPGQLASSLSTEGSGGSTYNQVSNAFDKIMFVLAFSTCLAPALGRVVGHGIARANQKPIASIPRDPTNPKNWVLKVGNHRQFGL